MKRIKIKIEYVYITIFILLIICIGFLSAKKICNFYINDETDYNEWNADLGNKFETDIASNFWLKYQYVNLNGLIRNILNQREMNNVIKLNNGYLTVRYDYIDNNNLEVYAKKTAEFQKLLDEKEIDYVWLTLPYTLDKYDNQMPVGIVDEYGNDNLDRLVNYFEKYEINNIDLRENLHNQGMKTYDIFYKTDHHWTTEGGFWAYKQVVSYIEEKYGIKIDEKIKDIDEYNITKYPKWHLGGLGQRTGKYYAGIDDFDLITPKFETYVERCGTNEGGTMTDMMIDLEPLKKTNYMSRYTYDNVMMGSQGYWYNPNASSDLRVMVIGDSMSKAVMPYLALSFRFVAYGAHGDEAHTVTSELVDSFQPDIIISMDHIVKLNYSSFDWGILKE